MNSYVPNRTAIQLKTLSSKEQSDGTEQDLKYPYYVRDTRNKRNKNFSRQCFCHTVKSTYFGGRAGGV